MHAAVTPSAGQSLDNGTAVKGQCTAPHDAAVDVHGGDLSITGAAWEVDTVDPARVPGAGGGVHLLQDAATYPSGGAAPRLRKIDLSHEYGMLYDAAGAIVDRTRRWYVLEGSAWPWLGDSDSCNLFTGSLLDASITEGDALALYRPGPYLLRQWKMVIHMVKWDIATAPPPSDPECAGGEQYPISFSDLLLAPKPSPGVPGKTVVWQVVGSCATSTATPFYVLGNDDGCDVAGDMQTWPKGSPSINQYDAGAALGLPVRDQRAGGNACGPSSLLMGMLTVLKMVKGGVPALPPPSFGGDYSPELLKRAYDKTMSVPDASGATGDFANLFVPARAQFFLEKLGWVGARTFRFGSDEASIADATTDSEQPQKSNEAILDAALREGPVLVSTAFSTRAWGQTGGGHIILIEAIAPTHPREYVVDDPAGDYFSSPNGGYRDGTNHGHYGRLGCGYHVLYPKSWVLANIVGRTALAFGRPAEDPTVLMVRAGDEGGTSVPRTLYLKDAEGRRTGWIDGDSVREIPDSDASSAPAALGSDTAGGDPDAATGQASSYDAPSQRYILILHPADGLTLHADGVPDQRFTLTVDAGAGLTDIAHDELIGVGSGTDTVLESPALRQAISAQVAAPSQSNPPLASLTAQPATPVVAVPGTDVARLPVIGEHRSLTLSVPRQRLAAVLARGLKIWTRVSTAATITLRVTMSAEAAAQAHTGSTIARRTLVSRGGRQEHAVRFTARATRALMRRRVRSLRIAVTASAGAHETAAASLLLR